MFFAICALFLPLTGATPSLELSLALRSFYGDCSRYDNDHLGVPVCGSDGITYRNPVYFSCINHLGNNTLKMISIGSCPGTVDRSGCPWSAFYDPVCGTDGKTYVNLENLMCSANKTGEDISVDKKGECEEEDPCCKDEELSPGPKVCASNGITYPSARVVRCLTRHKADFDINHEGGCSVDEVIEIYPSREKICSLSRHHYEYNPVCGANDVSYLNPFIFLCYCPMTEAVFSGGKCDCEIHEACKNAINLDEEYEECRKDVELKEVCGYDGLTYRSSDHLTCASKNNSLLTILHEGKCMREDSPCLRAKYAEGFPVCGSDGVTYSNVLSLFCIARIKDKDLKFVHVGPCVRRRKRPFNILSLSIDGGDVTNRLACDPNIDPEGLSFYSCSSKEGSRLHSYHNSWMGKILIKDAVGNISRPNQEAARGTNASGIITSVNWEATQGHTKTSMGR